MTAFEEERPTKHRRIGRPRLLTPERAERILDAIGKGATRVEAARAAGVHKATVLRWMQEGEAAESGLLRDFHDRVREADAAVSLAMCQVVTTAAHNGSWQAAAWWLERRRPDDYGRHLAVRREALSAGVEGSGTDWKQVLAERIDRLLPTA